MSGNEQSPNSIAFKGRCQRSLSDVSDLIRREQLEIDFCYLRFDRETKEKIRRFARYVLETESIEGSLESLNAGKIAIFNELNQLFHDRFCILLKQVEEWKIMRIPLLQKLENYIEQLDRSFKLSSMARLVGSSAEVLGSASCLLLSAESNWATFAYNAGSALGFLGCFSTVMEMAAAKKILDEVLDLIKEDYELLESIVNWFNKNEDLDFSIQDSRIFPFGIDKDIANQVLELAHEMEDYFKLFMSVLVSNVRKDNGLLTDPNFFHGLQLFMESNIANMWWTRLIFRRHPIVLDLNRMTLQMEFGQMQSLVLQSIPALPLEQQRLTSLTVGGRLMLNGLTIYDSLHYIHRGAKSVYSDHLRRILREMKRELNIIDSLIEKMKPVNLGEQSFAEF